MILKTSNPGVEFSQLRSVFAEGFVDHRGPGVATEAFREMPTYLKSGNALGRG
jgi:hypothetical protein